MDIKLKVKAERISRSASFKVVGKAQEVFPLFGPVLEKEWAEGWDPEIIFSSTGLVDLHMIFQTKASDTRERNFTWIVTQFEPEQYFVEYTVFTQLRIWFIAVQCKQLFDSTETTVTYTYTGTSDEGNDLNREALEKMFAQDLRDWQEAINHYLVKISLTTNPK